MPKQSDASADISPFEQRLVKQIRDEGPLRFDAFMQAALYDPQDGFYSGAGAGLRAGKSGDFVTAPTLSPIFARAMARFVHRAWRRLGEPMDWLIVEPAGGTGALLAGVVEALEAQDAQAVRGLRVLLVDVSPAHRAEATRRLKRVLPGSRVQVTDELKGLDAPGVVLVNELLDNLPVRLLLRQDKEWWEKMVDVGDDGSLCFTRVPAPPQLVEWVESFGMPVPENHQLEVPVGVHGWFREFSPHMQDHPVVLALVDYGETARDLLGEPRPEGTVVAYEAHKRDRDVLVRPGGRDITVHLNWSDVARTARSHRWQVLAFTDQFSFLSSMGALEDAVRLAQQNNSAEAMEELSSLKEVLLPGGMGDSVKVLVLARGLGSDADWIALQGTRDPEPPARTR